MRAQLAEKAKAAIAGTMKAALARTLTRAKARRRRRIASAPIAGSPLSVIQPAAGVAPMAAALDPVALVELALDRLSPASFRSSAIGVPTVVRVPDEATAAIFRQVLARSVRHRCTDRLVSVEVVRQ